MCTVDLCAGIGIDVGVDTTTPMSPGQKFRHWCAVHIYWHGVSYRGSMYCSATKSAADGAAPTMKILPRRELQGVKVRIEIGPKEAQESSCILSVCTKPGEVAAKTPLKVSRALLFSKTTTAEPVGQAEVAEAALRGCCPVAAAAGVIRLAFALKRDM